MALKPEHAKFAGYFNVDNGTGAIRGIYLQGNEAVAPIFEAWMKPFNNLGMTTLTIRDTGGTDHQSFDAVGLPGFQFIQDPVEYDTRTHHSNMDIYERIQEEDMRKNAVIVAAFVYHAANRDEKLPRKPLPRPPAEAAGRRRRQCARPLAFTVNRRSACGAAAVLRPLGRRGPGRCGLHPAVPHPARSRRSGPQHLDPAGGTRRRSRSPAVVEPADLLPDARSARALRTPRRHRALHRAAAAAGLKPRARLQRRADSASSRSRASSPSCSSRLTGSTPAGRRRHGVRLRAVSAPASCRTCRC